MGATPGGMGVNEGAVIALAITRASRAMEVLHEQIVMLQADRAAAQEADEAPRRGSGRTWQALGHGTGQRARRALGR